MKKPLNEDMICEQLSINEAFKALEDISDEEIGKELLEAEEKSKFNLNDYDDIDSIKQLIIDDNKKDDDDTFEMIRDIENDEVKDSYEGDTVVRCNVCGELSFRNAEDLIDDPENEGVVNVDEECPHCGKKGGFTKVGTIVPFDAQESAELKAEAEGEELPAEEDKPEDVGADFGEEKKVEESLTEDVATSKKGAIAGAALGAVVGTITGVPIVGTISGALKGAITGGVLAPTVADEIKSEVNHGKWEEMKLDCPNCGAHNVLHKKETNQIVCPKCGQSYELNDNKLIKKDNLAADEKEDAIKGSVVGNAMRKSETNGEIHEELETESHKIEEGVAGAVLGGAAGAALGHPFLGAAAGSLGQDVVMAKLKDEELETESCKTDEGLSGAVLGGAAGAALGHPIIGAVAGSLGQDVVMAKLENDDKKEEELDADAVETKAVESIDEELFDSLVNNYVHEIYENVDHYETTSGNVDYKTNELVLEGVITFKSGKTQDTKFMFEAGDVTKRGKVKFVGLNETFASSKRAFTLQGIIKDGALLAESLTYNYTAKTLNESKRIYGRAENKLTEGVEKSAPAVSPEEDKKEVAIADADIDEACCKEECDKKVEESYEDFDNNWDSIKQELLDAIKKDFPDADIAEDDIVFDDSRSWSLYVKGAKLGLPYNKFGAYRDYEGGGVRGPLSNNGKEEDGTLALGKLFANKLTEIEDLLNKGFEQDPEWEQPTGVLLDKAELKKEDEVEDEPKDEEKVEESLDESITNVTITTDGGNEVAIDADAAEIEVEDEDGKIKVEIEPEADMIIDDEPFVDDAYSEVDAEFGGAPEMIAPLDAEAAAPEEAAPEMKDEIPADEDADLIVPDDEASAEVDDEFKK